MLDIGFLEIVVIGSLALIVVGPKDLPGLLRTVGQFVAKARGMARDFQKTMEDAARDADMGDVADAVKKGGKLGKNSIVDSLKEFEKTVKTEVNEATAAVKSTTSGATTTAAKPVSATAAAITATPEVKPPPPRSPKADDAPAKSPEAKPAAAKPAAEKVAAKKPAAKKPAKPKATTTKPAAKPAAAKKPAAKSTASTTSAKSA